MTDRNRTTRRFMLAAAVVLAVALIAGCQPMPQARAKATPIYVWSYAQNADDYWSTYRATRDALADTRRTR